jgi:hypothetical protein
MSKTMVRKGAPNSGLESSIWVRSILFVSALTMLVKYWGEARKRGDMKVARGVGVAGVAVHTGSIRN